MKSQSGKISANEKIAVDFRVDATLRGMACSCCGSRVVEEGGWLAGCAEQFADDNVVPASAGVCARAYLVLLTDRASCHDRQEPNEKRGFRLAPPRPRTVRGAGPSMDPEFC